MSMTSGNHGRLLKPGLFKVALEEHKRYPSRIPTIFNMETSQRAFEEGLTEAGFGLVPTADDGAVISYDDMAQGYYKQVSHDEFRMAVRMSRSLRDDDLYGVFSGGRMGKCSKALAAAVLETREVIAARVINSATATTHHTVGDGLALASASHTLVNSQGVTTYSNLYSGYDLDESSLEGAIDLLDHTIDDRGKLQNIRAKFLLVPSQNRWQGKKVLNSGFEPGTGNNAINPLLDENLQLISWPQLTDADSWNVLADKSQHSLRWFDRVKPEYAFDGDFETEDSLMKVYWRHMILILDWRGIVHAPGA